MSKRKSKKTPSYRPPAQPDPVSEWFYSGDQLQSERVYDKEKKGYISKVYQSPEEQAIENKSTQFISGLVNDFTNNFDMSPAGQDQYINAYKNPQITALNRAYDDNLTKANTAANTMGTRNSVGFERFKANQLDKNRAEGLADIEANAEMMRYQLPSIMMAPYADAFNLANAALSGEQSRRMSSLEPSFQGSQAAEAAAQQRYANTLNNYNNAYNMKLQQSQQGGGGFFSKLFGF